MFAKNSAMFELANAEKMQIPNETSVPRFRICERGVVDQRPRLLIRGTQGFNSEKTHIEDEVKDPEDEVEDGRDK